MSPEALSILIGAFLPFVVSFLKSASWPREYKFGLAVAVSLIAGFLTAYFNGQVVFTWSNFLLDAAIIFQASQVVYAQWFRDSAIEKMLAPDK